MARTSPISQAFSHMQLFVTAQSRQWLSMFMARRSVAGCTRCWQWQWLSLRFLALLTLSWVNKLYRYFQPSRGLVLGETRSPFLLAIMPIFFVLFYCSALRVFVAFDTYGVHAYKVFEDKAEEAILFIYISSSRGLVLGETRSPYLFTRQQLTFWIGLFSVNKSCKNTTNNSVSSKLNFNLR